MSRYQGGYENKPQWQNMDGSAHLKWLGGGNFQCVKQKEEQEETKQQEENPIEEIPDIESDIIDYTDLSKNNSVNNEVELESVEEKVSLESLNEKLNQLKEMISPILHWVVDQQLKKEEKSS